MEDTVSMTLYPLVKFTLYSFLNTTIITGILILLLIFITNRIKFLPKVNIVFTYLAVFIIGIRLLTPFEFSFTKGINSFVIMNKVKEFSKTPIIHVNTYSDISILHILCFIWILGAAVALFRYFSAYYKLVKLSKRLPICKDSRINNILSNLKYKFDFDFDTNVIIFPFLDSPSEFGILSQTIFLNSDKYTDRELYFILLHELEHFHNRSNIMSMFLSVVSCIYWWYPVVKLFKNHVDELIETYVDSFVAKELSHDEKYDYLRCIFDIYKSDNNTKNNRALTESIIGLGSKNKLLNRFKTLAENKNINTPICVLMLIIMSFYVFCSARYVVQPAGEPPKAELMPLTGDMFNSSNSYIVKEGDYYVLFYNGERLLKNPNVKELPKVPIVEN